MRALTARVPAIDGRPLFVRIWTPDDVAPPAATAAAPGPDSASTPGPRPRGVVQLVHGMAEHSARYERFARAATEAGLVVVADDHRGHGRTAQTGELGHTADADGWHLILSDLSRVREAIDRAWPGVPVVLMGHSWGSLLVRGLVTRDPSPLAGLLIMGTLGEQGPLARVGLQAAKGLVRLRGPRHPEPFLEAVTTAPYEKALRPMRTEADWLSRDEAEVDAFLADPLSGFTCTTAFYRDLLTAVVEVNRPLAFTAVPTDLPVHVVGGACDPAGGMGEGAREVADRLRSAGVRDVTLRVYPQARHELLNELNRKEVTADLLAWIGRCLARQ